MFITLTHDHGRVLANVNQIFTIVEHDGKVYVSIRGCEPVIVNETYDDILYKIEQSKSRVW